MPFSRIKRASSSSSSANCSVFSSLYVVCMEVSYLSWRDVPVNDDREETIIVDDNGQRIGGLAYIPQLEQKNYPPVICSHGLGGSCTSCMEYAALPATRGISYSER